MKTDTKFNKQKFLDKIKNYSDKQLLVEGFTIEEKIYFYKFVITSLKYKNEGICIILWMHISNCLLYQIEYLFPELLLYKPEGKPKGKPKADYWFNTKEERITVLNKIIRDLKAQINK